MGSWSGYKIQIYLPVYLLPAERNCNKDAFQTLMPVRLYIEQNKDIQPIRAKKKWLAA
jgi:hypothetical protein